MLLEHLNWIVYWCATESIVIMVSKIWRLDITSVKVANMLLWHLLGRRSAPKKNTAAITLVYCSQIYYPNMSKSNLKNKKAPYLQLVSIQSYYIVVIIATLQDWKFLIYLQFPLGFC